MRKTSGSRHRTGPRWPPSAWGGDRGMSFRWTQFSTDACLLELLGGRWAEDAAAAPEVL